MNELVPFKAASSERVIELDFASSTDRLGEGNFVILAPKKEGKLDALHYRDGKAIRRTIGIVNQQHPQEIVQMVDPATGVPKYKLGDPRNVSGLPGIPVHYGNPSLDR